MIPALLIASVLLVAAPAWADVEYPDRAVNIAQLDAELRPLGLPGYRGVGRHLKRRAADGTVSAAAAPYLLVRCGALDQAQRDQLDAALATHVPAPPTPSTAERPDQMRRALGTIFAGTPLQKRQRWGAVLEAYPAAATILTLLRDPLTPDGKQTIIEIVGRIKARIGQPNEVMTQTEYDALAALAASHNLGGLVP